MQDRPSAPELLRAAREFCERELLPQLTGRLGFHTRVLANVLGILEREWEEEEEAVRAEWQRLGALLGTPGRPPPAFHELRPEVTARNRELARTIRDGYFDGRWDEVVSAVYETICEKLAIANPGYAEGSSDT